MDIDLGFDIKEELPFDQQFLVKHASFLKSTDFKKLQNYDISEKILSEIMMFFFLMKFLILKN